MGIERPALEQPAPPKINRRKFIAGATGAAVATGALAYLGREKLGFGPLPEVREAYSKEKEALRASYEKTGELPAFSTRRKLALLSDLTAYMERGPDSKRISFEDFQTKFDEFSANVLDGASRGEKTKLPAGIPASPVLRKMLALKLAFHTHAGTTYNKKYDSIADPILEKRSQCRSGTEGLLLLAQEATERDNFLSDEILVAVHTYGHAQPGLLLKNGELITFEMTSAGHGIRNFGRMTDIKKPIRVVRADHGMFQEALDTNANRDKAVLYETVRDVVPPEQGTMAKLGKFGFGEPQVPDGDIEMPKADMLPADDVFSDARLYNRMEREQSEEEVLRAIRNPEEREFVRNYMVHHRTLVNYYNAYVVRFNEVENITEANRRHKVSEQAFLAAESELNRLIGLLEEYERANALDGQYARAQDILGAYNKTIRMVAPSDTARVMRHNLSLLKSKR
ncbi:MAG: hypothetical protein AAB699_02180 [Patescibacteria group bacterium]